MQVGDLGERCKFPQRGLGQSPSGNRIWCILSLQYDIWWQQFYEAPLSREAQGGGLARLPQRPVLGTVEFRSRDPCRLRHAGSRPLLHAISI